MADIFKCNDKMPPQQSPQFVTAALCEPLEPCHAQVPGSYNYPRSIEHAPLPKIGKN